MIAGVRTWFPSVLEIGAGTGLLTDRLDRAIAWKRRIVNDLVEEYAQFHTHRTGTIFLPGDAETLKWGCQHFDLICSNAAFQWLADLPAFFKKLRKVLAPDGLLAFTSFGPDNLKELRALTGHGLHYYSIRQLTEKLVQCGFTVADSREEVLTWLFDDPLDILKKMRQTGVTASSDKSWWTPRRLAEFRRAYLEQFGTREQQVKLTWHPVYILAKA